MIPQDPMILLSYLNTRLRDDYPSLAALCDDLELDEEEIIARMEAIGFSYREGQNRFA
ncbi:MAG: DUF4250 domain-containing protein [Oscillospiraceae bacterium]|nr:DUF4250 domain-containing protein [Oscillospiraceae bacterium]